VSQFDVAFPERPGPRTRVVVATGAFERVPRLLLRTYPDRHLVIVSDARVGGLYGRRLARELGRSGARASFLSFPQGERSKTRAMKARLEDRLLAAGVGRDAVIVALGGGVTGDLAGFVAATWHRGVPVVQVPTTTLAMIDAALGGKTGVDLPAAKNLVGAFHQPDVVIADVRLLRTLPARTFRAGLAEAVKIAAALDEDLFASLERWVGAIEGRDERRLARIVARCLELKGRIVVSDERDAGRRAVLNFGHTAAHALEAATGYRIPHGEAVAIGLVAESRLAERLTGFQPAATGRLAALLRALRLPTEAPRGLSVARLGRAMVRDKKTRGAIVRCVLPERLGRMPAGPDPSVAIDPARDLLPLLSRH
jgi:3-dehydroquinate synthase